jgi:hypothetical protein
VGFEVVLFSETEEALGNKESVDQLLTIFWVILLCTCLPVYRSVGCCRDDGFLLFSLCAAAQFRFVFIS